MIVVCAPFLLDVKAQNLDPIAGAGRAGDGEREGSRIREYHQLI